jgi:tetratricopeptide (TPR) repeat protein
LVTLLAYLPVRQNGFIIFDDGDYLTQNHVVQSGLTWAGFKWAFLTWHASNWHPLTWLSHMLDCELFGLDPGPHHLVNAVIHAGSTVVLFLWLFYLTDAVWAAALVAALFAWHPLHVESVAWASERKDTLSTLLAMLALLAYARYGKENHRRALWLALVFFALGLLAKPMLVTLPFVFLLVDFWPLGRFKKVPLAQLVREKWLFFALAAASSVMTYLSQREASVLSLRQWPLPMRLANVVLSYGEYLFKTVWPVDLSLIYPLSDQLPWGQVALAGAVLLAVSWAAWRLRRSQPYLLMGWCWFLGTLVPVIGLVQVGRQAFADRYTYLPLVGVFIAAVFGIRQFLAQHPVNRTLVGLLAGVVLADCLCLTERQLSYWRDDETLWRHCVQITRGNVIAHINLGVTFESQNRNAEALSEYLRALRADPYSVEAHNNLANFLDDTGNPAAAMEHYREAIRLYPIAPLAHCNLGTTLVELGRYPEAMQEYAEAERLAPENPHPLYLMGKAALKQGDSAAAVEHFRDALRVDKEDFQSLTYLARVLASDPDPKIRNGAEALALAGQAADLTEGTQPFVLDAVAMAQAETGDFDQAQETEKKALQIAGDQTNLTVNIQAHLNTFADHRSWRELPANAPFSLKTP